MKRHETPALRSSYSRERSRWGRKQAVVPEGGIKWRHWGIFHGKDEPGSMAELERLKEEERWFLAKSSMDAGVVLEMLHLAAARGVEQIGWGSRRGGWRVLSKARIVGIRTWAQALASVNLWEGLCCHCLSCWRAVFLARLVSLGPGRVSACSEHSVHVYWQTEDEDIRILSFILS